jgi:2-polyprenyl-3-methyl-5-hydroxy-6-metoxy-1,4-benzoquinol methylase
MDPAPLRVGRLTMTDYKSRFYEHYHSGHVAPRKGAASVAQFEARVPMFERQWGPQLPADRASVMLDVGCGSGGMVWWLQQQGYPEAGGIDVSPEQIEVARSLGVRGVEQADLRDYLRGRPGRYDRIFLRDVLEHFERPDILAILDLCRTALRPGGAVVLQVPNAEPPLGGRIRWGDMTHEMAFTESSLQQLLRTTGFDRVTLHPAGPILLGPGDLPRHLLWKFFETVYRLMIFAETGRRHAVVTENIIAAGYAPGPRERPA